MSARKLLVIRHACDRFEANRNLLVHALEQREPRQCLDAFVELCSIYLEQTGGTLQTATYRGELTALAALVAERPHVTLLQVTPTPKDPQPMILDDIRIAQQCLFCGAHGLLTTNHGCECEARCSGCYEGDPDGGPRQRCVGNGKTASEAIGDWIEAMELTVGRPWYWPTDSDWQRNIEMKRQTGWVRTETRDGIWYAPEMVTAAQ